MYTLYTITKYREWKITKGDLCLSHSTVGAIDFSGFFNFALSSLHCCSSLLVACSKEAKQHSYLYVAMLQMNAVLSCVLGKLGRRYE